MQAFFTEETHCAVCPLHVLAFQIGNVALVSAQVAAQLVKSLPSEAHLGGNDSPVFHEMFDSVIIMGISRGTPSRRQTSMM